ncbi:MAG: hypothetical protein KF795_08035 [Labilithrix sp.]|nr:hypothetical protein [Labilithrix sp.]
MIVRIGTMFMGEVDAVGAHSVQTKFFVLGVPLVPLSSVFFTAPGQGIEIPLHGKSVLAGYLRLGLGLATLLLGIFAFVTPSYRRGFDDFAGAIVCGVAFIASFLVLGRVSAGEKARREILRARTGLAADPAILPTELRSTLEGELRGRLEARGVPLRPDAWLALAAGGDGGPYRQQEAPAIDTATWCDLYAYARYASLGDRAWRDALEPVWAKVAG